MTFSPRHYQRLKSRLRIRYQARWRKIQKNLKKLPPSDLKTWVKNHAEELSQPTNTHWFFLKQLETLIFVTGIDPREGDGLSLSPDEEKLFDLWNHSEFADVFLKELNRGRSVGKASAVARKHLEEHLLTLGKRHVERVSADSKYYRVQTSLGERLRNGKVSPLLTTTLHLDGKDLELRTHTLKEMNLFSQRIDLATKLIRRFSPESWERFSAFTDVIVPIRIKEFVSYSHQDLPGVSMINLYDRDFVDLLDDLLHENGHHHLNHYLNLEDLIEEPAALIYYSPWRRTLRPLRGIYHAFFTFFWALELFYDVASADFENIWYEFSPEEKEKIYWRVVEEFHMLSFTLEDLVWARKKGLISDRGWELVTEQKRLLRKMAPKARLWEKKLKPHRKDLLKLKAELRSARKHYKKS